jgi:hypothetical protein
MFDALNWTYLKCKIKKGLSSFCGNPVRFIQYSSRLSLNTDHSLVVCAVPPSSRLWLRVSLIKLKILDAFSGHSRSFDLLSSFFTSSFDILPFFTFRLIFSLTRSSNVLLWIYFCRFNFILCLSSFAQPNSSSFTTLAEYPPSLTTSQQRKTRNYERDLQALQLI